MNSNSNYSAADELLNEFLISSAEQHNSIQNQTLASEGISAPSASALIRSASDCASLDRRQRLILLLLQKVCSLSDPTPRSFLRHVVKLHAIGILSNLNFIKNDYLPNPNRILTFRGHNSARSGSSSRQANSLGAALKSSFPRRSRVRALKSATAEIIEETEHKQRTNKTASAKNLPSPMFPPPGIPTRSVSADSAFAADDGSSVATDSELDEFDDNELSDFIHGLNVTSSRYQSDFDELERIGKGSFGTVFKCRSRVDGSLYAVKKIVFRHSGFSPVHQRKIFREVKCLAKLDHKNCLRFFSAWLEPVWESDRPHRRQEIKESSSFSASPSDSSNSRVLNQNQWITPIGLTNLLTHQHSSVTQMDESADPLTMPHSMGEASGDIQSNYSISHESPSRDEFSEASSRGATKNDPSLTGNQVKLPNLVSESKQKSNDADSQFGFDFQSRSSDSADELASQEFSSDEQKSQLSSMDSLSADHSSRRFPRSNRMAIPQSRTNLIAPSGLKIELLAGSSHSPESEQSLKYKSDRKSSSVHSSVGDHPIRSSNSEFSHPLTNSSKSKTNSNSQIPVLSNSAEASINSSISLDSLSHLGGVEYKLCLYLQCQYAAGQNLLQFINSPNRLISSSLNISILVQILSGLAHLHKQRIIHRDLKPSNIFITSHAEIQAEDIFALQKLRQRNAANESPDEFNHNSMQFSSELSEFFLVKLGDFGLAKDIEIAENGEKRAEKSSNGGGVGTAIYASPEQANGDSVVHSDIYSIGIILFELFNKFSTAMERFNSIQELRAGKISNEFQLRWPNESAIILWMCKFNPADRPTALELLSNPFVRQFLPKQNSKIRILQTIEMAKQQNKLNSTNENRKLLTATDDGAEQSNTRIDNQQTSLTLIRDNSASVSETQSNSESRSVESPQPMPMQSIVDESNSSNINSSSILPSGDDIELLGKSQLLQIIRDQAKKIRSLEMKIAELQH